MNHVVVCKDGVNIDPLVHFRSLCHERHICTHFLAFDGVEVPTCALFLRSFAFFALLLLW